MLTVSSDSVVACMSSNISNTDIGLFYYNISKANLQ